MRWHAKAMKYWHHNIAHNLRAASQRNNGISLVPLSDHYIYQTWEGLALSSSEEQDDATIETLSEHFTESHHVG
jgi:hypothetical protein